MKREHERVRVVMNVSSRINWWGNDWKQWNHVTHPYSKARIAREMHRTLYERDNYAIGTEMWSTVMRINIYSLHMKPRKKKTEISL